MQKKRLACLYHHATFFSLVEHDYNWALIESNAHRVGSIPYIEEFYLSEGESLGAKTISDLLELTNPYGERYFLTSSEEISESNLKLCHLVGDFCAECCDLLGLKPPHFSDYKDVCLKLARDAFKDETALDVSTSQVEKSIRQFPRKYFSKSKGQ